VKYMQTQSAVTLTETRGKKMEEKSKTELLAMSLEDLKQEEDKGWNYFKRVKTIIKFLEMED